MEEKEREKFLDLFRGCLMGVATGDALGAPVEFMTSYEIKKRHGGPVTEMLGGGWLHLEPGQWTDDTALTLALAETYASRRAFDGLDFMHRLIKWFESNPPDIGQQTRAVLEFTRDCPARWNEAGREIWYRSGGSSAGNGSLMRSAPTAMVRWNDVSLLVRDTILSSQMTHYDPRCCEACIVLNFAIVQCLHGRFSPELAEQALLFLKSVRQMPIYKSLCQKFDTKAIETQGDSGLSLRYSEARDAIDQALQALPDLRPTDLKTTGYVADTLQTALWIALNTHSFNDGLVLAVNLGGDSDTLGAVVGALLGARFGISNIPYRWGKMIAERARIVQLANELFEIAPAEPPPGGTAFY